MTRTWSFVVFAKSISAAVAARSTSIFFALLFASIFLIAPTRLHANDGPALIQEAEISRLAKILASKAVDSGMLDGVCRLYLADREGVIEALVAARSFVALSDAISGELNNVRPQSGCEVVVMETTGQLSRDQISEYPRATNRPGAVFALVFFPSRGGIMVFANGYRADGRSAVFTDRFDVAIKAANELDSSGREGLGGPAVPVRQQDQAHQSQSPIDEGLDEVQLEKNEKSFLDRLRESAGTERAE